MPQTGASEGTQLQPDVVERNRAGIRSKVMDLMVEVMLSLCG